MLRFFDIFRINNQQLFPAGVIRERDAHDVIVVVAGVAGRGAGVSDPGYSKHLNLHSFQFFKRKVLEQCATGCGQVVLHWIGKREEIAPGAFQSIP